MGEMGLPLADLHTRGQSSEGNPCHLGIIDLAASIENYVLSNQNRRGNTAESNHTMIRDGIRELVERLLEANSMNVPGLPSTNHFGEEGKHVLKVLIPQKYPPDPIVVAAKGANNFFRQRGMRLLTGCRVQRL